MIGVTGATSNIAVQYQLRYSGGEIFSPARNPRDLPLDLPRYLLCAGALHGKRPKDMLVEELEQTIEVNYLNVINFCEDLFDVNKRARVCVIGSMSCILGSYDHIYAGSKAALHCYVKTKKLLYPKQQLVAIAPTIIEDSAMTQRRKDLDETLERGKKRRQQHWLKAAEVAHAINFVFNNRAVCNTVLELTGGNW